MAITKPQLKSLVKSQLPEFVREEYDTFVQFLQAYYEFLETTQVNLNTTRDLDNTLESFVSYFKNELAAKLPYSTIDERFLLQHIKDHYRAKGSENSFKLLFRILFNKEVTLDYPSKQMLRASDGKWNQDVSVFVRIIQGNPNDIVGKLVDVVTTTKIIRVLVDRRQYVEVEVDRAIRISDDVYEFIIDRRFFGNISVGDRLRYRDDANGIFFNGTILTTTASLIIQQPGTGFKVGDLYNVKNFDGYGSILKVSGVTSTGGMASAVFIKYGIGYTTDFTTTISSTSGQDVAGTAGTIIQRVDSIVGGVNTLSTLTITKAVNGGAAVIEKEEELSGNTLAIYEYKGVTEASVGTEIYTFTVADKSGNSTSKTITITNIGDPGLELIDLTVDNNGDFFRVYNFRAPTGFLGAYYLGQGPMAYNDPNSQKDIQDSTAVGEKWVGRWTSRNGSTFKKMSADKWNSITNDATIVAAWAAATGETSVIDLKEGDAYLVNIKGTSTKFAAVLITALDKTVAPKEFAQFVYKIQQ